MLLPYLRMIRVRLFASPIFRPYSFTEGLGAAVFTRLLLHGGRVVWLWCWHYSCRLVDSRIGANGSTLQLFCTLFCCVASCCRTFSIELKLTQTKQKNNDNEIIRDIATGRLCFPYTRCTLSFAGFVFYVKFRFY